MKRAFAMLSRFKNIRLSKKNYLEILAIWIGVAFFTPILPWTGRYDYRPVWQAIEEVGKSVDYPIVNVDKLKRQYESGGYSPQEIDCMTSRDAMFDILEVHGVTSNSLGKNLGLRSSSVPVFLIANTIILSLFSELSWLDFNERLSDEVAQKCKQFPGRFVTKEMLDLSRE